LESSWRLVLRGIFILLGAAVVERYTWVFFIFGAFLIFTALKLQSEGDHEWKEGKLILWLKKRGSSQMTIALLLSPLPINLCTGFNSSDLWIN
jgi:tellurite resistance protein TerC